MDCQQDRLQAAFKSLKRKKEKKQPAKHENAHVTTVYSKQTEHTEDYCSYKAHTDDLAWQLFFS